MILTAAAVGGSSLLGLYREGEYSAYGLSKLFEAKDIRYRDYKTFTEATGSAANGAFAALSLNGTEGESVTFYGTKEAFEAEILRLGVTVTERQSLGGIEIVYGYTEKLRGGVNVDGKRVNIELAYRGGTITVGTPVILGSY